jgi:tetratricopeptide (TPR) repeat protein
VVRSLRHLAEVYSAQDRYRDAIASYQRVASIQERPLATHNPELAVTLKSWALLLRKVHQKSEAAELEQRARAVGSKP